MFKIISAIFFLLPGILFGQYQLKIYKLNSKGTTGNLSYDIPLGKKITIWNENRVLKGTLKRIFDYTITVND